MGTSRGAAAAATWIFRGDGPRRRGHDVDIPRQAGATPALSRWADGFGESPPLRIAATAAPALRPVVAGLDLGLKNYDAAHVAMLGFPDAAALARLPFDVTRISNDADVATIVRRGNTLAIHSTADFAARHKNTMGSTQHTSRTNDVDGRAATKLHGAFKMHRG